MTTIPIADEKDLRLIADMEFANDTSPEEKTLLRKWTKMFEEVRDVRLEITRCKEMIQDKTLPGVLSSWLTDPSLAAHIKGEEVRADKIDAEMKPLWAEYEVLRDRMVPVRREKAERVQKLLMNHGVQRAQEIIDNGCTGLFRLFLPSDEEGPIGFASGIHSSLQEGKEETAIETVRFVRENMGGARVSLPCYVGPDRYCLIHQTIGGLQFGQKALHADQVRYISRDLTPEEKGHVNLVENVRRREGNMRDGKAILTGQRVPDDLGIESLSPQDAAFKRQMDAAGVSSPGVVVPEVPPFTCPEHGASARNRVDRAEATPHARSKGRGVDQEFRRARADRSCIRRRRRPGPCRASR